MQFTFKKLSLRRWGEQNTGQKIMPPKGSVDSVHVAWRSRACVPKGARWFLGFWLHGASAWLPHEAPQDAGLVTG